jgi:predicted Rossmann fold nucleotide-binding protein DprA/Smf involved in DNA uptake
MNVDIILCALYLRGAPGRAMLPMRGWPQVLACLRREDPSLGQAVDVLRRAGHSLEAAALEAPGLLSWAERMVDGERVLCASSPDYPSRWLRWGGGAPPAFYRLGSSPSGPFATVVGSRRVARPVRQWAESVGAEVVLSGWSLMSGGAPGCDRAAAFGARRVLAQIGAGEQGAEPAGSSRVGPSRVCPGASGPGASGPGAARVVELLAVPIPRRPPPACGCLLSLLPAGEPFSAASAMERNRLLYAASASSVVVDVRFREGGTWSGAVEALRLGTTRLWVRSDPADPAHRALMALGAAPLDRPEDLRSALLGADAPEALFGCG